MPSIESQQSATLQALNDVPYSEWIKTQNPIPLVAGAVAAKGGQMAGQAAMKGAQKGAEVTAQAAEDIIPAVTDWAGSAFDSIKSRFNPDAIEVDINSKQSMEEWDWTTKRFEEFDGDWVYYNVSPAKGGEPVLIKVKYDPMYDWDFEPMPWDEEPGGELETKLGQAWQKHLGSKETVKKELLKRIAETQEKIDKAGYPGDEYIPEDNPKSNPNEEIKGGNEMTTEQKVEEKQNPPANPTLYEGVTDPNFLPPKTEEVKQNPPEYESLDAEWESATTPEAKRAVKKKAFVGGMSKCQKGKRGKDDNMVSEGKKLLDWSRKHRVPKNNPQPEQNPKPEEAKPEEPKPETVVEPPKPEEPKPEVPETNQAPVLAINPPETVPEVKPPEKPECNHTFKYLGLGNPVKGGAQMKVFKCTSCGKTFAKGV